MMDKCLSRLLSTTTVVWFVMLLAKVLTTTFLWEGAAQTAETIMFIVIVMCGPAWLFLYMANLASGGIHFRWL